MPKPPTTGLWFSSSSFAAAFLHLEGSGEGWTVLPSGGGRGEEEEEEVQEKKERTELGHVRMFNFRFHYGYLLEISFGPTGGSSVALRQDYFRTDDLVTVVAVGQKNEVSEL